MHITDIPQDTLSVEIDRIPMIYAPSAKKIIARSHLGRVLLNIDGRVVALSTITAHRIGLAIARSQLAPDEMVILIINGERVELLWQHALQVSAALLRKADDADDWQLNRSKIA
jgi:hypothetical protein